MRVILTKILMIVFSFLILTGIELCGRLIPLDHLEMITTILEEESILFWIHRKNYRGQFFGGEVITDDYGLRNTTSRVPHDAIKILVMGASPSFGWGVNQNETYAYLLEKKLALNITQKIFVYNGSVIGYSSYQGKKIFSRLVDKINPDIVIIAYVINDVGRVRFFRSNGQDDEKLTNSNEIIIAIRNRLLRFATYRLLKRLIASLRDSGVSSATNPRVSIRQYINNIDEIVKRSLAFGAKTILLKMPVNLYEASNLSKKNKEIIEMKGIELERLIVYNKEAKKYNQALDDYARRESIPFVDVKEKFDQSQEYLYLDREGDTIHPNNKGHEIIADELAKRLLEMI